MTWLYLIPSWKVLLSWILLNVGLLVFFYRMVDRSVEKMAFGKEEGTVRKFWITIMIFFFMLTPFLVNAFPIVDAKFGLIVVQIVGMSPLILMTAIGFGVFWKMLKFRFKNPWKVYPVSLDYDLSPDVKLPAREVKRHVRVIGATGSGKTKSVLLNFAVQQIQKGAPLIVMDPKGDDEVIATVVGTLRDAGRLDDLLYFDLDPSFEDLTNSYNPLLYGRAEEKAARILATMPTSGGKYAFFEAKQQIALKTTIKLLEAALPVLAEGRLHRINFLDILAALVYIPYSILYFQRILRKNGLLDPQMEKESKTLLSEAGNPRFNEFISGLTQHIYKFAFLTRNAWIINDYRPSITLDDVVEKGKVAYFSLRALKFPGSSKGSSGDAYELGKMILMSLQSYIAERQLRQASMPLPVLLMIDEAHNVFPPEFRASLEMARSAGMGIVILHQDLKQFEPDITSIIDNNTNTKIVMRVNESMTAKHYAELIGQDKRLFKSESMTIESPIFNWLGKYRPRAGSVVYQERYDYIVRPEEFFSLKVGEGIVINPSLFEKRYMKTRFYNNIRDYDTHYRQLLPDSRAGRDLRSGLNLFPLLERLFGDEIIKRHFGESASEFFSRFQQDEAYEEATVAPTESRQEEKPSGEGSDIVI